MSSYVKMEYAMFGLLSLQEAQDKIAENCRARRLQMGLTQAELAKRSAVALPTLRRFERQGAVSLENFLKLQTVLGQFDAVIKATEPQEAEISSIEQILRRNNAPKRQRGRRS